MLGGDDDVDLTEQVERAPQAIPLTAATTGFHRSLDLGPRCSAGSSNMNASSGPDVDRLPAPVAGSGPVAHGHLGLVLTSLSFSNVLLAVDPEAERACPRHR